MTCDVWRLAYTCHRVLVTLACILVLALCALPPIEKIHNKWWLSSTTLSPLLDDGQKIGDTEYDSPDFRVEEPLLLPLNKYREEHRPYRLSPHYKMASRLRLRVPVRVRLLFGVQAADSFGDLYGPHNASLVEYGVGDGARASRPPEPSLPREHPRRVRPENVNRSHPLPVTFDLAVLATTYGIWGWYTWGHSTPLCPRASSNYNEKLSATPRGENIMSVGYQFMWAYRRVPTPFHKYLVRSHDCTVPCPKKEWGWFICVKGYPWARYGMDSGAAAFRSFDGNAVRQEGLVGIHTVAMKLRSVVLNLYYTVLDTHNILDFLYSAYLGRLPYEYLDYRFIDSQWTAPRAYAWAWIIHDYTLGEEWDFEIPRW
ncbi:unnamed protein product [Leptosia nina]|uniref:Uncharacterized protein n=1 Tax=Leptosia nina TaxID=320188 RepID=A0AAV1IYW9_9NEOP